MTRDEYVSQHSMEPHIVYGILYREWRNGVIEASKVEPRKIVSLLKHYELVEDFEKCQDISEWLHDITEAKKQEHEV